MPPSRNPRTSAVSKTAATPGRPEYAAEFLRRNRRFQNEYARMARMIRTGAVTQAAAHAAFARRWGLSFRRCAI